MRRKLLPANRRHRHQFGKLKSRAKQRGISWSLTFDQWLRIWKQSGHLDERDQVLAGSYRRHRASDRRQQPWPK
jgi:hypothetical protein